LDAQKRRALNRVIFAEKYIDSNRNYGWDDVIQPGIMTVFDLRAAPIDKEQALKLVLVISNIIRRNAKNVNKLIVFDEAHEYMGEKLLTNELDNMLTQIRHDGLSFILASQFPEHIPQKLFRFFNTQFLFQITNKKSFEYLKKQIPDMASLTPQKLNLLPKNKGICYLITSTEISDPRLKMTLFEFRPRMTLHGGGTIQNLN
jgi:DNA helicase HerA-like ATPase